MSECSHCGLDSERIDECVTQLQELAKTLRELAGVLENEADQVSRRPEELEPYDREKCWHVLNPDCSCQRCQEHFNAHATP